VVISSCTKRTKHSIIGAARNKIDVANEWIKQLQWDELAQGISS